MTDGTIERTCAILGSIIRGAVHDRNTIAETFDMTVASADRYLRALSRVPGVVCRKRGRRLAARWYFNQGDRGGRNMSRSPFCDACGAKVEWTPTKAGAEMPIDPDPSPQGRFFFGPGMKLFGAAPGTKPRMFSCHWDTCSRKGEPRRPKAFICDFRGCEIKGPHGSHCFRCSKVGHWAADCPGDES